MDKNILRIDGIYPVLHLGPVAIPTYYLVISFLFCVSLVFFLRRVHDKNLRSTTALDLSLVIMIFGFIGARLTSVIFEDFSFYREHPSQIFAFWNGGYVFLGGFLASACGVLLLLFLRKDPIRPWLDALAPVCAAGYAMGRVACFLTGCCYGAVCTLRSGFAFRHPTQLYAVIWESMVCLLLLALEKRQEFFKKPGRLFALWLFLHACGRIMMEAFRADYRGPQPLGLSLATWLCLGLILTSVWMAERSE